MQDEKVFDYIVSVLKATGKFRHVSWGDPGVSLPSDGASVVFQRFEFATDERFAAADFDERRVTYRATLSYRNPNPDLRKRRLLNYEGIIINSLHHKRLADLTMPRKTTVARGRDDLKQPEGTAAVVIEGVFTYAVPPMDAMIVEGL